MMAKRLEDLQVGDTVIVGTSGTRGTHQIHKVEKVTATQITINGIRFMKSTGNQVGESHYPLYIAKNWQTRELLTAEEAEQYNRELKDERYKLGLVHLLSDIRRDHLRGLSTAVLEQAAAILGLELPNRG